MMYLNKYRHCEQEWEDKWDCMCNDECPVCGAEIEPYESEDILESVELIASGYEWTCPDCETCNGEIEVTETVTCRKCKEMFPVSAHNHAIG